MLRLAAGFVALAVMTGAAPPQSGTPTPTAAPVLAKIPSDIAIFPIDELKPGMRGVGRTVFANQKLETFEVEIIGALENAAPKQTMVMARLTGGPLAKTVHPNSVPAFFTSVLPARTSATCGNRRT